MQKIFELSEKHFLTGIAPSSQVQDKGLFHRAKGITAALDTFLESDSLGLLSAGPAVTDLTGSVIVDKPFAWATDIVDQTHEYLYVWGDNGHLYRLNMVDNSISDIGALATANSANGIFVVKHATGKKILYLWSKNHLDTYGDLLGTPSYTGGVYTAGVVTTDVHCTHKLFDRYYFANGNFVGTAYDNGGADTLIFNATALDLEASYAVKTLSDDGANVVIGATTTNAVDSSARGTTKVFFWDGYSSSWQREWEIPEATIYSIRRQGSAMVAVTSRGLWAFTFNSPPEQLLPYTALSHMPTVSVPSHAAADALAGAVLWGAANRVASFGKLSPAVPNAFFEPITGIASDDNHMATMVCASAKTGTLYIGTEQNKLYTASLAGGTPAIGVSAETIFLDLGRWWQLGRIVIEFGGQLVSGDDFSLSIQPDSATSSSPWGTATYATHGAIRTREMYGSKEARKLKLIPNFNGGAVKIRRIEVWGDPITTPSHTRV